MQNRSQPRVLLALLLTVLCGPPAFAGQIRACPSPADPADAPKDPGACMRSESDLEQENQKYYQHAKIDSESSPFLDQCFQATQAFIRRCDRLRKALPDCQQIDMKSNVPDSMPAGSDLLTKKLVAQANCYRDLGSCFQRGPPTENHLAQKIYLTCTAKGADHAAAMTYYSYYYVKIKKPETYCLRHAGDQFEKQAADNFLASQQEKSDKVFAKQALICAGQDTGNCLCRFFNDGADHRLQAVPTDSQGVEQVGGFRPARVGNYCSGFLLGDGQTVVTDGHCTRKPGPKRVEVFDAAGIKNIFTADCARGIEQEVQSTDVSICRLPMQIKAKPVYLATLDSTNHSDSCTTVGYQMNCGVGFFQNLTQQPVSMLAYPAEMDGNTLRLPAGEKAPAMAWTTGVMMWNSQNQNLTTDMMCTGGCSGGGYAVEYQGREVIVAAHGYDNRYITGQGGAAVIPTEAFNSLKVQSVQTQKLEDGSMVFQQMRF